MAVRRALSIVLRTYKTGEADKVVVFFTREYGKIRGIARAARKTRSRFGGRLELGTELDLTFFEKASSELVSVDRCDIVHSRFTELGYPILASTLGYVTDLVDNFVLEREPNQHVYRLLRATVDAIPDTESPEAQARYFEAWLLRLVGFYPRHKTCPVCSRKLATEGARYLVSEHRIECSRCLKTGVSLSPQAVTYLEWMWTRSPNLLVPPEPISVLRELGVFHYRLIQEQLEKDLKSHQVFDDLICQKK